MKKNLVVLIFIFFTHHQGFSQDRNVVDSLLGQLKATKQDTTKAKILYQLSRSYVGNDPDKASDYARQTLTLSELINFKKGIGNAYSCMGTIACVNGDYSSGMTYFKKSLKIGIEIRDVYDIAVSYQSIGNVHRDQGNYGEALKSYITALKLYQKINNKPGIGFAYNTIGMVYEYYSDFPKALNYYFTALKVNEEIGNKKMIALSYAHIGDIYAVQRKDSTALSYYLRALKIQESIGNKSGMTESYVSIGMLYSDLGNETAALKNYFVALKIQEEVGNKIIIAAIYRQIGEAYSKMGNYDEALRNSLLSLKMSEDIGDRMGMVYEGNNIGNIYTYQKSYANASTYLNGSLKLAQEMGSIEAVNDCYDKLTALETARGNFKQALVYYRLFINSRDSMINEENNEKMLQQKMQYDFDKKETVAKAEQQKKDVIVQHQFQKQRIIRNSFVAGSILLLLLIVVLINRNKLKRTIEMEKMRSRLSRDLHDDIGSTLSSINILSRTAQTNLKQTTDEKTKASLEKINERSQRLLDNMSDIIWNINPGNDTIEEVMSRMREYATTILEAKNIDYTFNFPKEKMDCKLSMEVKNNMYLIFKEAVNNLSKYSGCTHANLSLTFDEKSIHMKIEDNGIGFNEDEIKHRGGLTNMQHRAEEIKGAIKINSMIEKGTVIELSMPRYC